ncbi:MAG: hypothetical protein WBD31_23695 [Rubripirellula sp.]
MVAYPSLPRRGCAMGIKSLLDVIPRGDIVDGDIVEGGNVDGGREDIGKFEGGNDVRGSELGGVAIRDGGSGVDVAGGVKVAGGAAAVPSPPAGGNDNCIAVCRTGELYVS